MKKMWLLMLVIVLGLSPAAGAQNIFRRYSWDDIFYRGPVPFIGYVKLFGDLRPVEAVEKTEIIELSKWIVYEGDPRTLDIVIRDAILTFSDFQSLEVIRCMRENCRDEDGIWKYIINIRTRAE